MVTAYPQAIARDKTEINLISTSPYVKDYTDERKKALVALLPEGDVKVLKGSAYAGKVPFELKVTKRTVTGRFNGRPVTFDVKDVKKISSKAAASND